MIQVLKKPTKKESTHVFIKYQASVIVKASRFREKFNLMVSGEDFCSAWTGESAVGWAQDIHIHCDQLHFQLFTNRRGFVEDDTSGRPLPRQPGDCRINFPVESFIFRSFVCGQLDFLIIGVDFQQFQPLFLGLPMSLVGGFEFLKIGVEYDARIDEMSTAYYKSFNDLNSYKLVEQV